MALSAVEAMLNNRLAMVKYSRKAQSKVKKLMDEMKKGTLEIGRSGRKQVIGIGFRGPGSLGQSTPEIVWEKSCGVNQEEKSAKR